MVGVRAHNTGGVLLLERDAIQDCDVANAVDCCLKA